MSRVKHSAGPWVLHTVENDTGRIKHMCPVDADGFSLLTIVEHEGTKFAAVYRDEDARRIVACANALEHISTEDLESGQMQNLAVRLADAERERDELLNALKKRCYIFGESHLSGYRLILGFNTLADVEEAHQQIVKSSAIRPREIQPAKNGG